MELLDNNITALGCEFLGKALHPKLQPQIQILKLDHNNFGAEGVIALAEGLGVNPTLRLLSLTYCGITKEGAGALFEILIYSKSVLEDINLTGNLLKDEGVIKLMQGVSIAKSLKKLSVADNQFSDTEKVMQAIEFCMGKNDRLGKYDFKYNNIGQEGK